MHRFRKSILVLVSAVGMFAVGASVASATGSNQGMQHATNVLHLLVAFKLVKWLVVGAVLAGLMAFRVIASALRARAAHA